MLGRNIVVLISFLVSALAVPLTAKDAIHDTPLVVRTGLQQDEDAVQSNYDKRAVSDQDEDVSFGNYDKRSVSHQGEDAFFGNYDKRAVSGQD
ncbi:uncharacterized protein PG986_010092 [Apiospora aurea]|uniref:Uncharacterized protein n=1 Tax=Apiospora aurea TaxID=335848 RepID=A0ABR1Q9H5_9PEZI